MATNLLNIYHTKRLNEVVFPGAHDAGTFAATLGDNVRTQGVDVAAQAALGCRYFDVRVANRKVGHGATARIERTTFHAPSTSNQVSKNKSGTNLGTYQNLGIGGDWGDSLNNILTQAHAFVTNGATSSEFLILRFSKSSDYPGIVAACNNILGATLYKRGGDLGTHLLSDLAGHVVTVYANSGGDRVDAQYTCAADGVIRIRELFNKNGAPQTYDPTFNGFQYFGKNSDTKNVAKNTRKQLQQMTARVHQDAVGMMYWTLTGIAFKGSIMSRMAGLWANSSLSATWDSGLRTSIAQRVGNMSALEKAGAMSSQNLKAFMPNIIMVDAVDATKCNTIFGLNAVGSQQLTNLYAEEEQRLRDLVIG